MLSVFMRVLLICAGIANLIYIIWQIKKTKLLIEESIFWFVVSVMIVLFGIFPQLPIFIAQIGGVESPVNLVYLFFIALLYFKSFQLSIKNSKIDNNFKLLVSRLSMAHKETIGKILLIIPCYNEQGTISSVIKSIESFNSQNDFYDYIVVNDGSTDETQKILERELIKHITHEVNCGLSTAFKSGCRYAVEASIHYDAVCQFDADGQHMACDLDKLRKAMEEGTADIIIGSRYMNGTNRADGSLLKNVSKKMITRCIRFFTGVEITDPTSGLRMYSDKVYPMFVNDINLNPEPDGLVYLIRRGFNVREVPVGMRERQSGKSYLTMGTAVKYMINIVGSIFLFQWWRD